MDYRQLIDWIEQTRSEALTYTDEFRELRLRIGTLENVVTEILYHLAEKEELK